MRILIFCSAYNSLTQRIHTELLERKHQVSIELALSDWIMQEAVRLFKPVLILCPYIKHHIPETIWKNHPCVIIHPGKPDERGLSYLDSAIQSQQSEIFAIAQQAAADIDAGAIWATERFTLRNAPKSSLYRLDYTEASVAVVLKTIRRIQNYEFKPEQIFNCGNEPKATLQPNMTQLERSINWTTDTAMTIVNKINAADNEPGVLDNLEQEAFYLYGAHLEDQLHGMPGELLASRHGAVCRATHDGAVWISHLKRKGNQQNSQFLKLPSTLALGIKARHLTEAPIAIDSPRSNTFREIRYIEKNAVGYLYFDFYNGAFSTDQCTRLLEAIKTVSNRPTKVLVLIGGRAVWCSGINLKIIEAAASPAEESWRNSNAFDDLVYCLLTTTSKLTIAAVHGNAAGGGVPLALACDKVCARAGVLFNPYFKTMGLYGSEYWTYIFPKRIGYEKALDLTESCRTVGMQEAKRLGLVDVVIPESFDAFDRRITRMVEALANQPDFEKLVHAKVLRRQQDEFVKPLKYYRTEELRRLHEDFFAKDTLYHQARKRFVYKLPAAETPVRLALHHMPMFDFMTSKEAFSSKSFAKTP